MPRLSKIGAAALAAFGWTGLSSVTASYLVVAGGGGGAPTVGGGGGAGGYQAGTTSLNPTLSYTVTVGAGGAGGANAAIVAGNQGSDSSFSTITANAGGKGGIQGGATDTSGGSSGGAGGFGTRTGTASQGNLGGTTGWSGAGGGGAGGVGADTPNSNANGGAGGAGTANSISGTSVTYAGGGGGGSYRLTGGAGGSGGGGTGGTFNGANATAGTANTGGGGGGGSDSGSTGSASGAGGSGVVIISYVGAQQFGGGVVTSVGGNTIHTFTTSGTLSPLSSLTASYLIVAGGGAGGGEVGGGGGAGGYLSGSGVTIDTNSIYVVTVGSGGAGTTAIGNNGTNSSFSAYATASVGGGGGGTSSFNGPPANGGSGGGSGGFSQLAGGLGTAGQGNNGGIGNFGGAGGAPNYPGGGGGGASGVGGNGSGGTTPGAGGTGTASSISGTSTTYAAGGAGGLYNSGGNINGVSATANTGNGGAGAYAVSNGPIGGNGGSGIVIISYPGSTQQMAGGTVTVAGGNVIHTFTSSGYLTPIVLATNSLRFRSSAGAYLNRTPATTTNRRTWTWSGWVKRGTLGTNQSLFTCYFANNDTSYLTISFTSDNLNIGLWNTSILYTSAVYRDPSAWYHIVLAIDTTQATASDRAKLYVNGTQVTAFGSTGYPAQNTDLAVNSAAAHYISTYDGTNYKFDGYMADINFIDGQALTPNSFGTFNGLGVWQPIRYGGSYGTNGFYLPFTLPNNSLSASYLVVAGGGGGGVWSGGGGAGGLLSGSGLTINTNSIYTVTVGSGGAGGTTGGSGDGSNGNNSVFSTLTSIGGGAGQSTSPFTGYSGGSGGGGSYALVGGGAGTAGQGNNGGAGSATLPYSGGGGGAGAVGASAVGGSGAAGAGGAGSASSISGSSVTYAGGGGGAGGQNAGGNWNGGAGGSGGGGAGGTSGVGTSGTANTGGGGGASGRATNTFFDAGSGGSGIVIVSYAGSQKFTGGTVTSSGGNTIHTFTSSGTLVGNIATDYSPQGNNWTTNNISLTSGSTYDSMTDVPTLTSATTANYCVMNPLESIANPFSGTSSNGNLTVSIPAPTNSNGIASTIRVISAAQPKFYIETTVTSLCTFCSLGMVTGANVNYRIRHPNDITINANDVIMTAFDPATGNVWYGRNGTWLSSGNPSAGTNPYYTLTATETIGAGFTVVATNGSSGTFTTENNFGQQPFAYTPPTGFVALNTFNLPTPTIGATASTTANKYFDIALRTSAGTAGSSVTSLNFQPDFVWDKTRSISGGHYLEDAVRGVGKYLLSQSTAAEQTDNNYISSFTSNGFTMGSNDWAAGTTLVDWCWKANGSGVTNTAGSIISSVSANTTAGFSIVTYTGNGTAGATIGHGLGVVPTFIIVKNRSSSQNWLVYSAVYGANMYGYLNLTNAWATDTTGFNNVTPTSTVFSVGTALETNGNGNNLVAYCFTPITGYSAIGSYVGNDSADGTFIYTGFRPAFVLYKKANGIDGWVIFDTKRNTYNVVDTALQPNTSGAEASSAAGSIDILSNGFKQRNANNIANSSSFTYIYMAFAESPFKYANAR